MVVENGAVLGKGGGFIRVNLATSPENLRQGAERFRDFWKRHLTRGLS